MITDPFKEEFHVNEDLRNYLIDNLVERSSYVIKSTDMKELEQKLKKQMEY